MSGPPLATELSASDVAALLTRRLDRSVEVTALRQAFPGVSRQTWLVSATVADRAEGFVLRMEHPWGGTAPVSLDVEFAVLDALWRGGQPVAEPLWCARDEEFLHGRHHMVRRLVEGSSEVPGLRAPTAAGAQLRSRVVLSHVEALGGLHTFDWRAAGLDELHGTPPDPAEVLVAEFEQWRRRWVAGRASPRPIVTEFLEWLAPHAPTDAPCVSLTKGNNGVGEEIFRDGRVVALSDFELSALSDPALDLAFTQGTLGLIDTRTALRHYEDCTGIPITQHRLAYAHLWNRFKALVNLELHFLVPFLEGVDHRTVAGTFGLVGVAQLERGMARWIGRDFDAIVDELSDTGAGIYA